MVGNYVRVTCAICVKHLTSSLALLLSAYCRLPPQYLDSQARPLNGSYDYTIDLPKDTPVNGWFWSLQSLNLDKYLSRFH